MLTKLKYLRAKYGISQQQLADLVGVSQQSINKYENHNVEPDLETLIRMADYFDTSVDFLIGHTESELRIEPRSAYDLNADEMHLVDGYRCLNRTEKEIVRLLIKNHSG